MNYLNGIKIDIKNKTTLFQILAKIAAKNPCRVINDFLTAKTQKKLLLCFYRNQPWFNENGFELTGDFVFPKNKKRLGTVMFKNFDFGKNKIDFSNVKTRIEFRDLKLEQGCIFSIKQEVEFLYLYNCELGGFALPNCEGIRIEDCSLDIELAKELMLRFGEKIDFSNCKYSGTNEPIVPQGNKIKSIYDIEQGLLGVAKKTKQELEKTTARAMSTSEAGTVIIQCNANLTNFNITIASGIINPEYTNQLRVATKEAIEEAVKSASIQANKIILNELKEFATPILTEYQLGVFTEYINKIELPFLSKNL